MAIKNDVYVSEKIGKVSTISDIAQGSDSIIILAHGAGAGMHHFFLEELSHNLSSIGISVVRFNFPYMENGKRRPDFPAVAHLTIHSVYEWVKKQYPEKSIYLSGKSFGGRMSTQYCAKNKPEVKGLIMYGFPLHPPGKPSVDRADHLSDLNSPTLFIQGDRDNLAKIDLILEVVKPHSHFEIKILEGANHSFTYLKSKGISKEQSIQLLAEISADWLKRESAN
jgi:predicted alpha/beta-hydrolase family hydrolase